MRKRYFTIVTNLGAVIIDRRAYTWTLFDKWGRMADWGNVRGRPDLLAHLQTNMRQAQRAYDGANLDGSD